jgi:hypothetical protein
MGRTWSQIRRCLDAVNNNQWSGMYPGADWDEDKERVVEEFLGDISKGFHLLALERIWKRQRATDVFGARFRGVSYWICQ